MTLSITTLSLKALYVTLSITTFSITTLSIKGLYVTLSTNLTQHKNTAILLGVVMLSVAFYLLLCWMSLCWVSRHHNCYWSTYQFVTWKLARGSFKTAINFGNSSHLIFCFLRFLCNCNTVTINSFLELNQFRQALDIFIEILIAISIDMGPML